MAYSPIWQQQLQQASWRGIPFQVETTEYQSGRRVAIHEYPKADFVWTEDMGLARQQISFGGFLVGDDVYDQRNALQQACNQAGSGTLVHPSLGSQTANLISASFAESKDNGRTIEVRFSFILSNQPTLQSLYPTVIADTQTAVRNAAGDLAQAGIADYANDIAVAIRSGGEVVAGIVNAATSFAGLVIAAGQDAARAVSAIAGLGLILPGNYQLGRYTDGNVGTLPSSLAGISGAQSVYAVINAGTAAMIAAATTAQAALAIAATTAASLAESDPSNAFVSAVQTLSEALRQAINDPNDQIRLLASLASFTLPATPVGTTTINAAIQTVTAATAAACRRAVLSSLARACASYQPTSANDVLAILQAIVPLFDAEILYAADYGDNQTYTAMRALRSSVVADLETRGSNLPSLIEVTTHTTEPDVVLAYRLYGDATRSDQLLRMNPVTVDPLSMPTSLMALSV